MRLRLQEDNLETWKNQLNIEMIKYANWVDDNYCECRTDQEWLSIYLDETVDNALWDEMTSLDD